MRVAEFFKNVETTELEKANALPFLKSKGVEKHIIIKESLLGWRNSNSIRYTEIASAYRYDKRIRNTLYKYISYLEEYYRAVILDNFYNDPGNGFWIPQFEKLLKDNNMNMNNALEKLEFSLLLAQVRKLPNNIKAHCLSINNVPNVKALNVLRNAVMHNKFLILLRDFLPCYISKKTKSKSSTLKSNIINLALFLPVGVKDKFINDINTCKEDNKEPNKPKWDLPEQIAITLQSR